jgi:response regulator RpfG family c-di-GMP phosphodiesterase
MKTRPAILVVDDTPANLSLLAHLLNEKYRVKLANKGSKALELAHAAPPDFLQDQNVWLQQQVEQRLTEIADVHDD